MNKRKQQNIENLLRRSQADEAPKGFTAKVMEEVTMLSDEALLKDPKMASLLKNAVLKRPSEEFSDVVMTKVAAEMTSNYQPIISKRIWIIISSAIIAFISYVLFIAVPSDSPSLFDKAFPYLEKTQSTIEFTRSAMQNFIQNFQVSSILTLSLLTLTILVVIDFLSRQRTVV
ncbi:MAG: hypothetical protein QNJ57_11230 [Flavobacteriaceae bacterium]|nr:hypothetical protein [Flavobacteriaceae bacterium]